MTTYELCRQLKMRGKLQKKYLDIYFANGRITNEEYEELISDIPSENGPSQEQSSNHLIVDSGGAGN